MAKNAGDYEALDAIDREILKSLERDGRATIVDVARAVNLSQNATADRLRRLTQTGTITGFTAQISTDAIGLRLQAFIDVKLRSERTADDFERELENVPGLLGCTLTTGSFDYVLRVACRDQNDLVRIAEYLRTSGGAAETYSRIILRERRYPITATLADPRR
jgi:Lrp/AsnC family transcriptional regulator, leucine-responsive regulatory protein